MPPKVRDAIRVVKRDGWYLVRTRGATGSTTTRTSRAPFTIARHMSKDITAHMRSSIVKQAGLEKGSL